MPQIIVMADKQTDGAEPPIMFRERVNVRDFESHHFASQLVERLGWAVGDAAAVASVGRPSDQEPFDAASASAELTTRSVQQAL
jgi:hypothetical protein